MAKTTAKALTEQYVGKKYGDGKWADVIAKVLSVKQNDGERTAALLSKDSDGYSLEALIVLSTGEDVRGDRCPFSENLSDAADDAMDVYNEWKRNR